MNKVLLVGCGHMGSALLEAWKGLKNYKFTVVDPFNYKLIYNKFKSGKIEVTKKVPNNNKISDFDIVIFAIKPQVANKVLNEYKGLSFKKNSVIVSIVAGKKINFFKKKLKSPLQIVRVMPNMPALINKGMSCLLSNKFVNSLNKKRITHLFSKIGNTVWLSNENQINISTAVSGSGPGYVFTIIDAMEKADMKIGLSKKIARELVVETFLGSIELMKATNQEPKKLANAIAVKGGTTEAGIKIMHKNKIHKIFYKTIEAAYKRANFLGK